MTAIEDMLEDNQTGQHSKLATHSILRLEPIQNRKAAGAQISTTSPYKHPTTGEMMVGVQRYKFYVILKDFIAVNACMHAAQYLPHDIFLQRACTPAMLQLKKSIFPVNQRPKGTPQHTVVMERPCNPSISACGWMDNGDRCSQTVKPVSCLSFLTAS